VLEGDRLVDDALGAGWKLEVALVADDRGERARELTSRGVNVRLVERELLDRVSALKTSPGILAIAPKPQAVDVATLALDARTLILVVSGIADPGNLGALARTAEAFGVQAIVALAGGASPWNEKALRGSMGSLLRVPIATGITAEACAALFEKRRVRQVCAATRGGADPARFDWKGPIALWVSGETGVMPDSASRFETLTIPMAKNVESLNVAVAASVLLFSAGRVTRG
jgi:TrmH family RNA methyltransferase